MERMTGHYVHVWGKMIFERFDFGVLAGRLATHDSILLSRYCQNYFTLVTIPRTAASRKMHTRTILGNDTTDARSFYAVENVVTRSRYQVTVSKNLYIRLHNSQHSFALRINSYRYSP